MKHSIRFILPVLPFILLFTGACSHSIPRSSTKPVPPPITSAMPSFAAMNKEESRAPISQVPVRITTDLTPIQTAIRDAVPERITETGHPFEQEFRWTFVRNGDPQVRIQDGLVAIHAEYKGEIEARGSSRACRLEPIYTTLDATGALVFMQDQESVAFGFEPSHLAVGMKPESDGRCNMFNISVKDQLPELFALPEIKIALAEAVQPEAFSIPFQRLWDDLEGPLSLPVTALNTRACLYGNPREVTVGRQKGTTQDTIIFGTAKQMPLVTYEPTCAEAPPTVALVNSGTLPSDNAPFRMLARIPISYQLLTHQAQNRLFHQTIVLDNTAAETAVIERVSAADANGRVLVTVETSGDLKGTIYYWGTPRLDDGGKSLSIPDLQMAGESKTAIDSIRVGYWQQVDRGLHDKLRQALAIDLSAQVDRMKQAITGTHRSGDLTMDILVTRQQPDRAQSSPQGLMATILLEGTAGATAHVTLERNGTRALLRQDVR